MKTLADLKRDLIIGKKIILKERFGKEYNEIREIFKVQSQSICMLKEGGGKSWLELPKASLLEYDGKEIKIFEPGIRELTEEEKKIKDNEPRDSEQEEIDMVSDGSTMFYRRKKYYRDSGFFYLFGTETEKGKRLSYADKTAKIEDDSIKGKLSLRYEVR